MYICHPSLKCVCSLSSHTPAQITVLASSGEKHHIVKSTLEWGPLGVDTQTMQPECTLGESLCGNIGMPAGHEDCTVSVSFAYLPHRTANRGRKTVTILWSYISTTPRVSMALHNTIIMEPKGSQNLTIIQEDGRSDFATLGRSQERPQCRWHQIRKDMRDDGVNDDILPPRLMLCKRWLRHDLKTHCSCHQCGRHPLFLPVCSSNPHALRAQRAWLILGRHTRRRDTSIACAKACRQKATSLVVRKCVTGMEDGRATDEARAAQRHSAPGACVTDLAQKASQAPSATHTRSLRAILRANRSQEQCSPLALCQRMCKTNHVWRCSLVRWRGTSCTCPHPRAPVWLPLARHTPGTAHCGDSLQGGGPEYTPIRRAPVSRVSDAAALYHDARHSHGHIFRVVKHVGPYPPGR